MTFRILVLLGSLALVSPLGAQQLRPGPPPAAPPAIRPADLVSVTLAGAVFGAALLLDPGPERPTCRVPCDPASLPFFDAWAVTGERRGIDLASTAVAGLIGIGTTLDLARRPRGVRHAVALVESGAWAVAANQWLKSAAGRGRPILYAAEATEAEIVADDLRAFPSAHTAGAFAVVTSWWLSHRALDGDPPVPGWVAYLAAAGVGVMRVTAGRHFPSDVVAGAALGVASALTVHAIRF